jgi:hypothetical protein
LTTGDEKKKGFKERASILTRQLTKVYDGQYRGNWEEHTSYQVYKVNLAYRLGRFKIANGTLNRNIQFHRFSKQFILYLLN